MAKYLVRETEEKVASRILAIYRASKRLLELGIPYLPAALFYGMSGTGKTELARYIAHKAELPFIYIRFSSLVNSMLGGTQSNISKVFGYAKTSPCVLCFDEIDAIGMKRGDSQDVSEMSRVTIALMQEMDALPNNVIIIGTTNRFDRLDPALVRRFPICHEVLPLNYDDVIVLVEKFFAYCSTPLPPNWTRETFPPYTADTRRFAKSYSVAHVVKTCVEDRVDYITRTEKGEIL